MKDYISVPTEEWLTYLLIKHKPRVMDIGDQRDPEYIIVCSCIELAESNKMARATPYGVKRSLIYSMHLKEILEKEYYNRLGHAVIV